MRFGEDWTGVFLRGDNAGYFVLLVREALLTSTLDPITRATLEGFLETIQGSDERRSGENVQLLKPWKDCLP